MRLFKVSQRIFFDKTTYSGIFKEGELLELEGFAFISEASRDEIIYLGYMQNYNATDGMTWYTKALYDSKTKKLTMLAATKKCQNFAPSIFCTHIPFFKESGQGMMDEADGTVISRPCFFIDGEHTGCTSICMKEISPEAPTFRRSRRKLDRMLNRYHTANLFMGEQFVKIAPNWHGYGTIIDSYPRDC